MGRQVYVYDHARGEVVPKGERTDEPKGPFVWRDIPPYKSPLGTGWIDGRRARREDLKRGGCREVDPSERPQGAPKTAAQAAAERAQMLARPEYQMSPQARERLLRGR